MVLKKFRDKFYHLVWLEDYSFSCSVDQRLLGAEKDIQYFMVFL
jgi:hypothetical protein